MYYEILDAFNKAKRFYNGNLNSMENCKHINPIDGTPLLLETSQVNCNFSNGNAYMCPLCNTFANKKEVDKIIDQIKNNNITM